MTPLLDRNTINECLLAVRPQSILDVGCGSGRWLEWCQKHLIDYRGFDLDSEVVAKAQEKFEVGDEVFTTGDISFLKEQPDNSYDVILMVEVIEHIRAIELFTETLKQCFRVTKRYVFMTTPNCSCDAMLKEHGLTYEHYAYAAADGMQFRHADRAHRHWLRFTFDNLKQHLERHFAGSFELVEKYPIKILTFPAYKKLWAVLTKEEE